MIIPVHFKSAVDDPLQKPVFKDHLKICFEDEQLQLGMQESFYNSTEKFKVIVICINYNKRL